MEENEKRITFSVEVDVIAARACLQAQLWRAKKRLSDTSEHSLTPVFSSDMHFDRCNGKDG